MKDFVRIFVALVALVAAFLFGRNYGEKSFRESEDYRNLVRSNEELNFTKSEFENAKTKFQNILDVSENKKNEELLTQILNVFLVDLGLHLQDKANFVKTEAVMVHAPENKPPLVVHTETPTAPKPVKKTQNKEQKDEAKRHSYEWMLANSSGDKSTLRTLEKLQIKNLKTTLGGLSQESSSTHDECEDFVGVYKGSVKDINNSYFGSMNFSLRAVATATNTERMAGQVAWYNEVGNSSAKQNILGCGQQAPETAARFVPLGPGRYIQLYKLSSYEKLAGNFYELLPNGTSKLIGSFVLNRVDKF